MPNGPSCLGCGEELPGAAGAATAREIKVVARTKRTIFFDVRGTG